MDYRKVYEQHFGPVPEGHQVHHILPQWFGGTDDIENLIALSVKDHALVHMEMYQKFGDFRDLCAYHLILNGELDDEAQFAKSSAGGKKGGTIAKALGLGIHGVSKKQTREWAFQGGSIGGAIQRDKGIGIHAQTREERLAFASMGGKASGVFQDKQFQSEMGKRGGVKNAGFRWYINGDGQPRKYTARQQQVEPFSAFIKRTGYQEGRK